MTPDVNVLLAAARPDHFHHRAARRWLAMLESTPGEPLLLFPMVASSFVRLIINPRIFPLITLPGDAFAFIEGMLAAPGARMPAIGSEWHAFRSICLATDKLRPNDIPDAWLAAAVREAGDHLVTFDTGFRRLLRRSELTILT